LRVAIVVAITLITGCSSGREEPTDTASVAAPRHDAPSPPDTSASSLPQSVDSLRDDFVEQGLLVSDSRVEVVAQLGQPDSMTVRSVINRHIPSQTDSIIDLFYRDLHLTYYVVGVGNKEFLQTAVVSANRYLKYPQVGIGSSETAVVGSLGYPTDREPERYRYDCVRCIGAESPVYFYFDRGKVQRIEYSFYVD
jgi:hypothetical protein